MYRFITSQHIANLRYRVTDPNIETSYASHSISQALGTDHLISGGGGAGIFPRDKLFFSLFLHNKLFFFKSKLQQVFNIEKIQILKSEKCKRKQHIE